jgi:membrane protein implicated in regulation of membrane protease activity
MDAVIATSVIAAASAVAGAGATVAKAWVQARGRQRAREESSRARLSDLPPGSRVIVFAGDGMLLEVGGGNNQMGKGYRAFR